MRSIVKLKLDVPFLIPGPESRNLPSPDHFNLVEEALKCTV